MHSPQDPVLQIAGFAAISCHSDQLPAARPLAVHSSIVQLRSYLGPDVSKGSSPVRNAIMDSWTNQSRGRSVQRDCCLGLLLHIYMDSSGRSSDCNGSYSHIATLASFVQEYKSGFTFIGNDDDDVGGMSEEGKTLGSGSATPHATRRPESGSAQAPPLTVILSDNIGISTSTYLSK